MFLTLIRGYGCILLDDIVMHLSPSYSTTISTPFAAFVWSLPRKVPLRRIIVILFGIALSGYLLLRSAFPVKYHQQSFPQMAHDVASFNKSTIVNRKDFTWQQVFPDFYVYSVYPLALDASEIHITLIGRVDADFWLKTVCYCSYSYDSEAESLQQPDDIVEGFLDSFPEAHTEEGNSLVAGRLRCPFSVTAHHSKNVLLWCAYEKQSGLVAFATPVALKKSLTKLSFAHCGSPIYGIYNDQPAAVVEFIEYYRLMGVSEFFWNWFDLDLEGNTMKVLKYYEAEGVVHLTHWVLPFGGGVGGKSVHYHGQVAALYDCVMRTAGSFDYTVIADLDEFYAVTDTSDNQSSPASFTKIVKNGDSDCAVVQSSFMDPAGTYTDVFESQGSSGNPVLRTASITKRSSTIFGRNFFHYNDYRSKYVCRMRHVDIPAIHRVWNFRSPVAAHRMTRPSPERVLLLHFRSVFGPVTLVEETRAAALARGLQPRVAAVWSKNFG